VSARAWRPPLADIEQTQQRILVLSKRGGAAGADVRLVWAGCVVLWFDLVMAVAAGGGLLPGGTWLRHGR
jgi:hypothetical protein